MDFPARPPACELSVDSFGQVIGVLPLKVLNSEEDVLAVLETRASVRDLKPNFTALAGLDCRGLIVTARGEKADFVSRFFAPAVGVPEDPVTGWRMCHGPLLGWRFEKE